MSWWQLLVLMALVAFVYYPILLKPLRQWWNDPTSRGCRSEESSNRWFVSKGLDQDLRESDLLGPIEAPHTDFNLLLRKAHI
jgi:hypothetical protein